MKTSARRILWRVFELSDIAVLFVCLLGTIAAFSNRSSLTKIPQFLSLNVRILDVLWILLMTGIWHIVLVGLGLYHNKRLTDSLSEIIDILKAILVCVLVYFSVGWMFNTPTSPHFLTAFWLTSSTVLVTYRMILRSFLKMLHRRNRNIRYMIIIGSNDRAVDFARQVSSDRDNGIRVIGFVDDEWYASQPPEEYGFRHICTLEGAFEYLRHNVVDEVYMALPVGSHYQWMAALLKTCEEHGISVLYPADFFNSQSSHHATEELNNTAIVTHLFHGMEGWRQGLKRSLDFVVSTVLLICFLPLFAGAAVLIKMTSPGPVFFRQKRIGKNKRVFTMYKFRTMVNDAERMLSKLEDLNEAEGPVFKIKNDPRVTRIGRILRKTSIDELPQLINVFRGEMSLVGPRPLPLRDYNGFDKDRFRRRLSVPPGITCIWQSSGRNNVPFEKWMEMDLNYIDNWSVSLDIRIIFRTIFAVVQGHGAS